MPFPEVASMMAVVSTSAWIARVRARAALPASITGAGRVLGAGLVILTLLYGAALRFDALTLRYGPVETPAWLRSLQESRGRQSAIRPAAVVWGPVVGRRYISDPFTYIKYATEMRSFYAAHRREPLFPFVTKVFLDLLNGQDVAVSFASASFSVLAILATYLLGSYAFSYGVGLGAALAMAIEYDVISWGVRGWRDDAFTCAVVLSCWALLRCSRVPSRGHAVVLGVAAGLSCLIRITSLSFLLPGFIFLLARTAQPWRTRLRRVGLAALIMSLLVGPFLINCWRVYGDPLHAINVHADVYRAAEGHAIKTSQTAAEYLNHMANDRPMRTLDTAILGLTTYPFANKWSGFRPWWPVLGEWLSWAAMLGLVFFVGHQSGRVLLLVLATSLAPYALTWRLIADWRFTEHAYPFFLIAACFAVSQIITMCLPRRIGAPLGRRPPLKVIGFWTVVAGSVASGVWFVTRVLPVLTVRESLQAHEGVTILAGPRDASFFIEGWSRPIPGTNVTIRVAEGLYSAVRIPLPRVQDYDMTVRLDPSPRPVTAAVENLPAVRVFMNGHYVATLALRWNPNRVGAYDFRVAAAAVRTGLNRLVFMADPRPPGTPPNDPRQAASSSRSAGFSMWALVVRATEGSGLRRSHLTPEVPVPWPRGVGTGQVASARILTPPPWLLRPAPDSALTKSPRRSAKAEWARSIGRATASSNATWQSRSCRRRSRQMSHASRDSSGKPRSWRR